MSGLKSGVVGASKRIRMRLLLPAAVAASVVVLGARHADAVPSFARQTGLACSACHTTFPEITPFGRMFKLHGYTAQATKELEEPGSDKAPPLSINRVFPLSVMFQTSITRTDAQQPGEQNANVEFPQALSLFLAGEITPHIGTFMQGTYDGHEFVMDNTDIRYANDTVIGGKELLYGVTLNNNPTVEDPWHSTPAWGFPFDAPDAAPGPDAAALVDGTLGGNVAGAGAYAMWDKHLYAAAAAYRSAHIGGSNPPTDQTFDTAGTDRGQNTIRDVAPYWRLAWQQNLGRNYLEVGTFGMFAQLFPAALSGATDKFTDLAFDTQFERPVGKDSLSAHLTYIYENQQLDATHAAGNSDNLNDKLHTLRLDAIYHWRERLMLAAGWFLLRGNNDATLYAPPMVEEGTPAPVSGSANGSPDSDGMRFEVGYYPWQNVRVSAQYTVYTEFNGRAHDYNGTARSAMDNNALYLLIWLMY
jgi:hypothetical protein